MLEIEMSDGRRFAVGIGMAAGGAEVLGIAALLTGRGDRVRFIIVPELGDDVVDIVVAADVADVERGAVLLTGGRGDALDVFMMVVGLGAVGLVPLATLAAGGEGEEQESGGQKGKK